MKGILFEIRQGSWVLGGSSSRHPIARLHEGSDAVSNLKGT